ncbi:hypothetical protein AB0F81_39100 [Actinoplanes sp. NPDC024001]|uniref:hypothetical protein n=1 Tax=Actinoplanes sp. NPDC024001 TaxID=3154598 RepID=UPI00340534C6
MGVVKDVVAWTVLVVLGGIGFIAMVRDAGRDRARRRSVVQGRSIRYGRAGSYRPRAALWFGLASAWAGVNMAFFLLFFRHPAVVTAVVIMLLLAVYFLLDQLGTRIVEGRVLECRIIRSGEDGHVENFWIAVDDGRDPIAGTPVSRTDYARVTTGAYVRLHLTPRGRQVKRLDVVEK